MFVEPDDAFITSTGQKVVYTYISQSIADVVGLMVHPEARRLTF